MWTSQREAKCPIISTVTLLSLLVFTWSCSVLAGIEGQSVQDVIPTHPDRYLVVVGVLMSNTVHEITYDVLHTLSGTGTTDRVTALKLFGGFPSPPARAILILQRLPAGGRLSFFVGELLRLPSIMEDTPGNRERIRNTRFWESPPSGGLPLVDATELAKDTVLKHGYGEGMELVSSVRHPGGWSLLLKSSSGERVLVIVRDDGSIVHFAPVKL